ncbi:MAG: hypothetical protein Kow00105_09100 [Phycisphaeraceae bacterium]
MVLLVLGGFAWFGGGREKRKPIIPELSAPTDSQRTALQDQLAELGDLFGQAMEHGRDVQPILERLDGLIAQYPESAAAHLLRGQVLAYANQGEAALEAFEKSLEMEPRQAGVHVLAGTVAYKLRKLERARTHYETALSIEPGHSEYAVYLANVQHKLGDDRSAVTTLLGALRRDSKCHSAYALLSDIYASQNKLSMALDQIERALEVLPEREPSARTAYVLKQAGLLRRANKPERALMSLAKLESGEQLRPDVMRATATCWAMLGKPGMAAEVYERALAVDPTNDHAAAEAVRWRLKAGDLDAARDNLNALRRINPRHVDLPDLEAEFDQAQGSQP